MSQKGSLEGNERHMELDENTDTMYQKTWNAANAGLRGKLILQHEEKEVKDFWRQVLTWC